MFDRLAVAVVDEQHRFGVRQRAGARRQGAARDSRPHVLHMTATPIPRTLVADRLRRPRRDGRCASCRAGRKPIATHVAAGERERSRAYERIREELRAGRQAFVVCPLVEESEALAARAATVEFERLQKTEFADFRVVLLHGQMRPKEKQAAMAAFAAGDADVLVATTVIEVGIDVPNATRDARRERRALRHLPAAPAARPRRARRARLGVPALRAQGVAAPAGARRPTPTASSSPRSISSCAARASSRARASQALRSSASPGSPRTRTLLDAARRHAEAILAADPDLAEPEHTLLALALEDAYGAEALQPIPA